MKRLKLQKRDEIINHFKSDREAMHSQITELEENMRESESARESLKQQLESAQNNLKGKDDVISDLEKLLDDNRMRFKYANDEAIRLEDLYKTTDNELGAVESLRKDLESQVRMSGCIYLKTRSFDNSLIIDY